MRNRLFATYIFLLFILPSNASAADESKLKDHKDECVILLHGLARSKYSMLPMEKYLQKKGYQTVNSGYPSTDKSIKDIADTDVAAAVKSCRNKNAVNIHFVTHSLGGIVVRQYLQSNSVPEGSRMVMLGPPNKGSELTDELKHLAPYKWINGPAGEELGTEQKSTPNRLKPVDIEIGIIAGNSSLNPLYSSMIPGPDDGKVAVEKTKLPEMKGFITLPYSHSFMMNRDEVKKQTAHFLENGTFDHSEEALRIKPFSSDGCSLFPDGTLKDKNLWCDCCFEHDAAYWRGGTENDRKEADKILRDCIKKKAGSEELAKMVYLGVRTGGSPVFPTWYRWGYGWPYGRGYKTVTAEEETSAKTALEEYYKNNIPYICSE